MATVARQNIDKLTDKLSVTINKEDYMPAFETKLKSYSKTANIPGFRKGNVPAGMIKKMYGAGIFQEEVLRSVEKELYKYLTDEKPEIFAQPLPLTNDMAVNMSEPDSYTFDFEIGLKPALNVAPLDKAAIIKYEIELTPEAIDEEISRMQTKGGTMSEPEEISEEDDVLNVQFTETNEAGEAVEGGIVKDNSVMLKYFSNKLQKELKGKKAGDSISFNLKNSFEKDALQNILVDLGIDTDDKNAADKHFTMKIEKIGRVEKRELNEAFYKEVFPEKDVKTEEEFKQAIKEDFSKHLEAQSKNQVHDQLYHYLLDETKLEFPEAFLKRWLQSGGEEAKTPEQVEQEFPDFINQLKWTLISEKLTEENKIEVSKEEVKEKMKQEVMGYFGQMNMGEDMSWLESYIDRMMNDEKHVESTYRRLAATKLFDYIESQVKPKNKKIGQKEFFEMLDKHKH